MHTYYGQQQVEHLYLEATSLQTRHNIFGTI